VIPTLNTAIDNESPAARILDLVARCAPKLMRAGGGSLSRELIYIAHYNPMTDEQRTEALALAKLGVMTATEIARRVGSSQSSIRKFVTYRGFVLPDGLGKNMVKRKATA
jgi:hypothetical protein